MAGRQRQIPFELRRAKLSEIVRILNEAQAKQMERAKRNEWVCLVVDVAYVCSHFVREIHHSSFPQGSLASLTHLFLAFSRFARHQALLSGWELVKGACAVVEKGVEIYFFHGCVCVMENEMFRFRFFRAKFVGVCVAVAVAVG